MTKYTYTHTDIQAPSQSARSDFFFIVKYAKVTACVNDRSVLCIATSNNY